MNHPLKPRILCIDDEAPVCELIRCLLERSGDFTVDVETNSKTAMDHARVFRPDLVLMDIKMPGLDGFTLARIFRQEPALRHRPILFFSGISNAGEMVRKVCRTGSLECLEKGVSVDIIEQTVRRILDERLKQYLAAKEASAVRPPFGFSSERV
jgi:PleD family two-component response regulator